jgi:hypothetical protein
MSNVKVLDLDLRDDNMVFAATHGRGVFSGQFTAASLSVNTKIPTSSNVNLFPTVSNGELYIMAKQHIENAKITVYNLNGQLVHSAILNITNMQRSLDLTNLKSGIYFVNILTGAQKTSHKIIIK